jgi:hypothetical protein
MDRDITELLLVFFLVIAVAFFGGVAGYLLADPVDIENCTDVERLRRVIDDGHAAEQRLIELMEGVDDAGH